MGTMVSKYGHGTGAMSSFYGAAWPFLCPNRPFPRWAEVGQRKNGRSVGKNLSATGCAWTILGGMQSGWEQFGAVKSAGCRVQLNARYIDIYMICIAGNRINPPSFDQG